MKGQHPQNTILPVRSILENSRPNTKKSYLQYISKDSHPLPLTHTPKHPHQQSYPFHQTPNHNHHHTSASKTQPFGFTSSQNLHSQSLQQLSSQPHQRQSQLLRSNYESKTAIRCRRQFGTGNLGDFNPQSVRQQSAAEADHQRIKVEKAEQNESKRTFTNRRDTIKSMSLNRGVETPKDSRISDSLSGKLEEETWNVSKFQKFLHSEKDSQPIFKNEITKIKTELFQKEANLFEYTQKLEQKDHTIQQLTIRLQLANNMNKNLKAELNRDGKNSERIKMAAEIERLLEEVMKLKSDLAKKKNIQEDDDSANRKIMMLKLKQYELDEREKTQFILQLREKEKRTVEYYQKLVNGQQQLLRQKEEQLVQISQTAHFYKEETSRVSHELHQETVLFSKKTNQKEEVIRELANQVSDLKSSLNELQVRMRQMIEIEDELKRQIQISSQKGFVNEPTNLKSEIQSLQQQNVKLKQRVRQVEKAQFDIKIKMEQTMNNSSVREFQLSMMEKTCSEYQRKIEEYHRYSEQMRVELESHKSKGKSGLKDEKISPRKSPGKEGNEQREILKLKQVNSKLFKENDRLSVMIKDLNGKVIQFYRVIRGLNEVIMSKELEQINDYYEAKFKIDE